VLLPAEHELLLRIIEAPEDDQLRLVLADALNARGDPLGEFITLQCALEDIRSGVRGGDVRPLKARERELLALHRAYWHQQAAPFASHLEFRRGLPHVLHASAEELLRDGGLTVLAPIRALELTGEGPLPVGRVLALPLLSRVQALSLGAQADVELTEPRRLPQRPKLPHNIRRLRLVVYRPQFLESVLRAGWGDHVEHLELSMRELMPFSASQYFPFLEAMQSGTLHTLVLDDSRTRTEREWLPVLQGLLESSPSLTVQWRTERFDARTLGELIARPTQRMEVPVWYWGREREVLPASSFTVERLADGTLNVSSPTHDFVDDLSFIRSLPPHPSRLMAQSHKGSTVRFEAWPSHELQVPLPPRRAVRVMAQVAEALELLSAELSRYGVAPFPTELVREDIWVGEDDAVKLLPPFPRLRHRFKRARLGLPLEGVAAYPTFLCGTALLHLLTGEPPVKEPDSLPWTATERAEVTRELEELRDRPLLPSMLNAEWKPLDPLVERCLTRDRARQFASLGDFATAARTLLPLLAVGP
jgi:uncharacterized protein (TIGR02996 family)